VEAEVEVRLAIFSAPWLITLNAPHTITHFPQGFWILMALKAIMQPINYLAGLSPQAK